MEEEGLTAKASSIHVNGWFGGYDKLSTARLMMREDFGVDLDAEREHYVFAGDSPNDQPMFAFFPNAVGVANVRDMAALMTTLPAWVTPSPGSRGFTELTAALLEGNP
jgi:hydroxymethylpyrimidine pyrophosphatase-like HAD family hydrolase